MEVMKKKKGGASVSLTKDEIRQLKKFCAGFDTEVKCALEIGIDRNVLNRVRMFGSGSPETIAKIRLAIAA
jgi:hypothetical protein